jgi:formylglycine-generating enzyme required for sulfatase activity
MKTKHNLMAAALGTVFITAAIGGSVHAQGTIDGSGGVDLGNAGIISGVPALTFADGSSLTWASSPDLQNFVVPAGQLTGLASDGSAVNYEDLLPIKATKLSVMAGAAGAAPTGTGTIIDSAGIETNGLDLIDTATSSAVPLTVTNGVLKVNGTVASGQADITPGAAITSGGFKIYRGVANIPGGTLTTLAGSAASIAIDAFTMDKTEITYAHYRLVFNWAQEHGYTFPQIVSQFYNNGGTMHMPANRTSGGAGGAPDHPAQCVHWYDAVLWCNARSEMEGLTPVYYTDTGFTTVYRSGTTVEVNGSANGYRLPTEAEWEWAARGGNMADGIYPWGDTTLDFGKALYGAISGACTVPVATFSANPYGLYEMAGNVSEWCFEVSPTNAGVRIFRGGNWGQSSPSMLVSARSGDAPDKRSVIFGFRTVRN